MLSIVYNRALEGLRNTTGKRLLSASALALLLGLGVACAPAVPKDAVALTGDEVKKLITGNTFKGGYNAQQLTMVFYDNGQLRGSLGLTGSDGGTWHMQGDLYCQHWTRYFSATEGCYKWYPRNGGYVLRSFGGYRTPDIIGKVETGKPAGY